MKKIILILLLLILGSSSTFAQDTQPVRFIYINGANNDTPQMKQWFFDGIGKLHTQMKKQFDNSEFVYEKLSIKKIITKNRLEIKSIL